MLEARVITEPEIVAEFNRRGYFLSDESSLAPGVEPPAPELPPGIEPPAPELPPGPEFPPGEEPPPPEFPPGEEPPVEKPRRVWLWLAVGLVVASLGIQDDGEAAV